MIKIFDSHSHLSFPAYDKDRDEVIARMKEQGVGAVDVGTTLKTSKGAVALAESYDFIWASVGIHPTEAPTEFDTNTLRELLVNPKVVAIGECGLDYFHKPYDEQAQKELFIKHLNLAIDVAKPVIIHCRDAHEDLLEMLDEYRDKVKGIIHFFTGTIGQARHYIDLGFYIAFDGPITFVSDYDNLVKEVPMERILIETDCPYATPAPYRGKRNEPVYVVEIAKKVAEIKGLSLDEVLEVTTKNTKELFNI